MIRAEVKICSTAKICYPCLKINLRTNAIVLFHSAGSGVCLDPGFEPDLSIGQKSMNWAEDTFEMFDGLITLSNERA